MKKRFQLNRLFCHLCMVIPTSCFYITTWASPPPQSLMHNTETILGLSKMIVNRDKLSERDLVKGVQNAEERRTILFDMLRKNTASVAKFLLPGKIVSSLPQKMQPYLEKEVFHIQGILEIRAAVNEHRPDVMQYILQKDDGTLYYLNFTDQAPKNLTTGSKIDVKHGYLLIAEDGYGQLIVSSNDVIIEQQAIAISDAFGQQTTIVFLANFQDQPTNFPFTLSQVNTTTFITTNNMYKEASFMQTSLVGNVFGWYTVPLNSTSSCDTITNSLPGLAELAAMNAGVNINPYIHRVYLFPNVPNCGWAGLGTVGRSGAFSRAWLNGYNTLRITGHELGHNMGVGHSHSLECQGTSNTGTCVRQEYGDFADIMGFGEGAHFNALQKEILGWLNYNISPPIQTVTVSGTYNIDPFEALNNNVKALKVLKRTGTNTFYYMEYRQPIGFDSILNCSNCDYTKGVLIHQGSPSDITSSELLDMSPTDTNKRSIVALLPGQSFTDTAAPSGGVTFRVNSVSSAGASVTVTYGTNPPPDSRIPI